MKFLDAVKLAEMNTHLIGKLTSGGRIDEIIIYPTDPIKYQEFVQEYKATLDPQYSIVEFINCDLQVGLVIDKFLIEENDILYFSELSFFETELGAILESI
ncbi:MAG: hypothetical protein PHP53_05155 [Prolixibacteraceae bacterium]|nr:hypothetical protein [Prolixibacteraceae bacterium]